MKKATLPWSWMPALIVSLAIISFKQSFTQGFSPQTTSSLQQVLQNFQNEPAFVGGITAAIKVDGLAAWQGATGYAARNVDAQNNLLPGGTNFTTATLSRMYSITKTFTAALALELAKEGALDLNRTVGSYLPLHVINPGLDGSVTVRQLLAHESGYSNYTDEMQFLFAVAFQPTHIWTPLEVVSFVHQINPPGTVRQYSSTNYVMLGAIIEAAMDVPVEQHYRTRFIAPLQMSSMYLGVREPQPTGTQLAAPHDNLSPFNPIFQLTGQPTFPNAYTNISAFPFEGIVSAAFTGGGLVSNAMDLATWGNALFAGRATTSATLDAMLQSIAATPDAQGDFLGYGIWKSSKMSPTETFLGHDGSAPGYRSVMFYQPEKKLTLVVMTNFHGADIYAIAKALYAALPNFLCGNANRKEDKIRVCYKGNSLCIDRNAADGFIKKGAYLGECAMNDAKGSSGKSNTNKAAETIKLSVFPNPARSNVVFTFTVDAEGPVSIELYDLHGKQVAQVFKGIMSKQASRQINFNNQGITAGTYLVVFRTTSGTKQQKVVFMK